MKHLILSLLLSITLVATPNQTHNTSDNTLSKPSHIETQLSQEALRERVLYTNLIGAAVVTTWGVAFWDYFTIPPVFGNEKWFQKDTKYGGADKFGHLYSTYLWSVGFSSLYASWGMREEESSLYGALTSWLFQGIMEVGDSFSDSQRFSYEDMVMNTLGAGLYYLFEKYPSWKEKVDLRLEYLPDFQSSADIFTQYNSMKYVCALKMSGFKAMQTSILRYTELQVGYYTRGYQNHGSYDKTQRVLYVGVGINISKVLASLGWGKTSKVFNYYQLPYSYLPFGYDFDAKNYLAPYSAPYHGYLK